MNMHFSRTQRLKWPGWTDQMEWKNKKRAIFFSVVFDLFGLNSFTRDYCSHKWMYYTISLFYWVLVNVVTVMISWSDGGIMVFTFCNDKLAIAIGPYRTDIYIEWIVEIWWRENMHTNSPFVEILCWTGRYIAFIYCPFPLHCFRLPSCIGHQVKFEPMNWILFVSFVYGDMWNGMKRAAGAVLHDFVHGMRFTPFVSYRKNMMCALYP